MTAAFTVQVSDSSSADDDMEVVRRRAAELREEALRLAERELSSYAPVLEAMRLDAATPGRERRVTEALSDAAEAPLAIARAAAEVAELGTEALRAGNDHLRGDAITGVLLAEAACRAAGRLVEINLAQLPDDPRAAEVLRSASRGDTARRWALDGG